LDEKLNTSGKMLYLPASRGIEKSKLFSVI
jgi:hypothetical protein